MGIFTSHSRCELMSSISFIISSQYTYSWGCFWNSKNKRKMRNDITRSTLLHFYLTKRSLWWIINKKKCLSVAWKNSSQPYYCSTWNLWKEEENWDEKNSRLSIISAQSLFHPSAHSTAECYSVTDDEERLSRFANCGRWKMSGVVLQHQGWKGEK